MPGGARHTAEYRQPQAYSRSITDAADTIDVSGDSATRSTAAKRSISQTAAATDAVTRSSTHPRAISDTAAATGVVTRAGVSAFRPIPEGDLAQAHDDPPDGGPTRTTSASRAIAGTAAATDSVSRRTTTARAPADTATPTDAVTRAGVSAFRPIPEGDLAQAHDDPPDGGPARTTSASRAIADTAAATDSVSRTTSTSRTPSDTASATDDTLRSTTGTRSASDTASATEAPSRSTAAARDDADTAAASDSTSRTSSTVRSTDDAPASSDSAARATSTSRDGSETAGATDSASRIAATARAVTESAGATEASSRTSTTARAINDTASATDAPSRTTTTVRGVADTALAFEQQYSNLIPSETGVVSYWRLDESSGTSAADSKGSNTGTYTAGYTLGQAGALAGDSDVAVGLNGTTGYVQVPDAASLRPNSITIEAWIKPTAVNRVQYIAAKFLQYAMWLDANGKLNVQIVDSTVTSRLFAGLTSITPGVWTHVAMTWDASTGVLTSYINGAQDRTQTFTARNIFSFTQPLSLGQIGTGANFWGGSLDEIALYNTALSAARIAAHYQLGANGDPSRTTSTTRSGADSATAIETTDRSSSTSRDPADVGTVGDGVSRTATFVREASDTAPAIDSQQRSPLITIISESPPKISKITGFDTATVVWVSDSDLDQYELLVVPAGGSPHSTGLTIPATNGSTTQGGAVLANAPVTSLIKGADLETALPGDGIKVVKVFGRAQGMWSG